MKSLLLGITLILIIGIGGFMYRNAVEHPMQPTACSLGTFLCPDGASVSRGGPSCTFSVCPPPNVSLASIDISFAVPAGFVSVTPPDSIDVAAYALPPTSSSTSIASITIRRYQIEASSTALATIQQTAIGSPSDIPVSITSFSSTVIGNRRFTIVPIERFEGVIDTAYYLARGTEVLRLDAIDRNVTNWTDPNLDVSTLSAHKALEGLLGTLQEH